MIGLLTTSCESVMVKTKRALMAKEELEAAEKKKKTIEYNSLQLSKLKDKWRNDEMWNKNENWLKDHSRGYDDYLHSLGVE